MVTETSEVSAPINWLNGFASITACTEPCRLATAARPLRRWSKLRYVPFAANGRFLKGRGLRLRGAMDRSAKVAESRAAARARPVALDREGCILRAARREAA